MATILVVDDRPENRELLVDILCLSGHELWEADDCAEALVMTRRDHPDLVIADILTPRMDGYEFVRELRADLEVARTPVIFYTAIYHQREARVLAQKCGVTHLLAKPVALEEVLRIVAEVLASTRTGGPGAAAVEIDRDHLRLLNDTMVEKVRELETANHRLTALINLGSSLVLERDLRRLLARYCRAGCEMIGAPCSAGYTGGRR